MVDHLAAADLAVLVGSPREEPPSALRDRILVQAAVETPAVVAAASRARRRRRWIPIVAGLAVFGLGTGSGVGLQMALDGGEQRQIVWGDGSETQGERIDFMSAQVDDPSAPAAWAWIGSGQAGTYAALYTRGLEVGETYKWWFETAKGTRVPLGSFVFPAGVEKWLVCPGSTSLPRNELVRIGATDSRGIDVFRSKLPVVTA